MIDLIDLNEFNPLLSRGLYLVPGTPFIYIPEINAIILSDLHLGYEEALARGYIYVAGKRGNHVRYVGSIIVPRRQLRGILEYFNRAFKILGERVEKVIINGDLKHAFDRLLRQEREEISKLIDYLREKGVDEIIVIRGNHDNYLPLILKKYNVPLIKGMELTLSSIGRVFLTHGHREAEIKSYDLVIIGHEHPALRCLSASKNPGLLIMNTSVDTSLIVLPASGPYQAGTVISFNREDYLSPIIRRYGLIEQAGIITWVPVESGAGQVFTSRVIEGVDFGDIMKIKIYDLDGVNYVYLGFRSLEDAMLICRL